MLKQKIDEYVRDFTTAEKRLTLTKSELERSYEDIVRLTATAMIGEEKNYVFTMSSRENFNVAMGRRERIEEEKLTKERLLEEIKNV